MRPGRFLEKLNDEQRDAVIQRNGPVLILAGAGTGKTRVITHRIGYLIACGVAPNSILAITFTNKAANEMRERMETMIKFPHDNRPLMCTFHSLAVRILRRGIDRFGYKKNFAIFAERDQMGLLRRCVAQCAAKDEKLDPWVASAIISSGKNGGRGPDPGSLVESVAALYQQELKRMNAVDFDDLLVLGLQLIEEDPDHRRYWRQRFPYLLVDEFQDTNSLQVRLLQQLAGKEGNVCVVGDDDQSIYGWRGAEIANILEFERHFLRPSIFRLQQNYRCPQDVLTLANRLIAHNRGRREKKLWSDLRGLQTTRLVAMPDGRKEAEWVVEEIWEGKQVRRRKWEEYAVLFRMNLQGALFEEALRSHNIPYRLVGSRSFFDRREIQDAIAFLHVLANSSNDIHMLRILNTPPRALGGQAVKKLVAESSESGTHVGALLVDPGFQETLSPRAEKSAREFSLLLANTRNILRQPSAVADGFKDFIEEIGYIDYLRRTCKTEEEKTDREDSLRMFLTTLETFCKSGRGGLCEFLENIALQLDEDNKDNEEKKKGVALITMHAAKGLEFPHVYVTGLEEGVLPHKRSVDEGNCDEERRLLYVAITRAQQSLTLSYCLTRERFKTTFACTPSRFLNELEGEELEEWDYEMLFNTPAAEDEADAMFAAIKAQLRGDGD